MKKWCGNEHLFSKEQQALEELVLPGVSVYSWQVISYVTEMVRYMCWFLKAGVPYAAIM